jgi:hypothetical protein
MLSIMRPGYIRSSFKAANLGTLPGRRESNSLKKIFLKPYAHLPKEHKTQVYLAEIQFHHF